MKIRWSPAATALARRYLRDQNGMRAIGQERIPYLLAGACRVDLTSALAKMRTQLGTSCLVSGSARHRSCMARRSEPARSPNSCGP